jgi:hypothetical protein
MPWGRMPQHYGMQKTTAAPCHSLLIQYSTITGGWNRRKRLQYLQDGDRRRHINNKY